ncbi:hypothetical protein BC827DRAFT_1138204 [Russula dissimulans]|nr:hypothetical protein BC827DRAFT_1138204 [Russula dissimulans]
MVKTGIPFMLEDKSGSLSGSSFVDLYERMCLLLRCTRRDPDGASQYRVYDVTFEQPILAPEATQFLPEATLEYGAAGALGNITIIEPGGSSRTQTMSSAPRHRKFIASDGQEYSWSWRTNTRENLEWSCVNASGHTVAWYALKIPGEQYADSSGCMFGVEEPYPHLAIGKILLC